MRHEPAGLDRWANTDPSLHCNTVERVDDSWRNEYLALLLKGDYDAAHGLRLRSDRRYREAGDDPRRQ